MAHYTCGSNILWVNLLKSGCLVTLLFSINEITQRFDLKWKTVNTLQQPKEAYKETRMNSITEKCICFYFSILNMEK